MQDARETNPARTRLNRRSALLLFLGTIIILGVVELQKAKPAIAQDVTDLNEIFTQFAPDVARIDLLPEAQDPRADTFSLFAEDEPAPQFVANLATGLDTKLTTNANGRSNGNDDVIISPSLSLAGSYALEKGKILGGVGGSIADHTDDSSLDFSIFQSKLGYSIDVSGFSAALSGTFLLLFSDTFENRSITFYRIAGEVGRQFVEKDGFTLGTKIKGEYSLANPDDFDNIRISTEIPVAYKATDSISFVITPELYFVHYDDFFSDVRNDHGTSISAAMQWKISNGVTLSLGGGGKFQGSTDGNRDYIEGFVPVSLKVKITL